MRVWRVILARSNHDVAANGNLTTLPHPGA